MTNRMTTLDAENALVGAILINADCLEDATDMLEESDFESDYCRMIYRATLALRKEGKVIDPVTIRKWAETQDFRMTAEFLQSLMENTSGWPGVAEYSRIVHEDALRRRLQRTAADLATDSSTPLEKLVFSGINQFANISSRIDSNNSFSLDTVEYEPPRWLIEPYFPRGKGTLIQADPGTGKTALICAVAASVSTGKPFMGLRVETPGDVVLLSTEDDAGVLRGRIEANGGDVCRVHCLRNQSGLTLNSPEIEQLVRRTCARLLIFDPFQCFLGSDVDLHRANETRPVLTQLFDMCSRNDCACVIIAHLGKATQGKSIVNQSLGSVDIPGSMRSIIHIARNPKLPGELLAFHVKSSNAPKGQTIAYSIVDRGGVEFHGFCDTEPEELERTAKEETYNSYQNEPLVQVFNQMLTDYPEGGFWSYDDLKDACFKILGCFPYNNSLELRRRMEAPGFREELMQRDSIRLATGAYGNHKRGIKLHRFKVPESYQMQLDTTAAPATTAATVLHSAHSRRSEAGR